MVNYTYQLLTGLIIWLDYPVTLIFVIDKCEYMYLGGGGV